MTPLKPLVGWGEYHPPVSPKDVPCSENSAWFMLLGRRNPLQNAHPFGVYAKDIILISLKNGSAILFPTFLPPAPSAGGNC